MKKLFLILNILFILFNGCKNSISPIEPEIEELIFVACEGNFGASNGSIYTIDNNGEVKHIQEIGDVVQSLKVHNNKLFVIINNSHLIKIYDITKDGLRLPGIEISTNNSSPRELVIVNDKVYFTNWNTKDIKVLNLFNYSIESSISVDGLPESIISDGSYLWTGIMMNEDYSSADKVVKIDINTNSIVETYDVGLGPTSLIIDNNIIYIARTYYDKDYNSFYGSTKIDGSNIEIKNYGSGIACGGSILKFNNEIYRSYNGGIAPLNNNLDIRESAKIGSYEYSQVYSTKIIGDYIYFGITNYANLNEVKVVDINGNEISSYDVGLFPGDFSVWKKNIIKEN